jgi:hypothetical protein
MRVTYSCPMHGGECSGAVSEVPPVLGSLLRRWEQQGNWKGMTGTTPQWVGPVFVHGAAISFFDDHRVAVTVLTPQFAPDESR